VYLGIPRTASVVATRPGRLHRLSASNLKRMQSDDPDVAAAFHEFIARLLAERLAQNSKTLDALLD